MGAAALRISLRRNLQRRMRGIVGEVDKKRLIRGCVDLVNDELLGSSGKQVGRVAFSKIGKFIVVRYGGIASKAIADISRSCLLFSRESENSLFGRRPLKLAP